MAMVVVYHGTSVDGAKQIHKDKVIKTTSSKNRRYEETTEGYVYVTKRLCDALDFSTRPRPEVEKENRFTFVVFRIMIDECELLPDLDESVWTSTLSDDGAKECFRIKRDLHIGEDVVAVFQKRTNSDDEAGRYMQDVQYGKIKIQENEWKNLYCD